MKNIYLKFGGYVIDAIFCILSIIAVVDFFIRGESHPQIQAAFGLIALYASGVILRIRYIHKQFKDGQRRGY